MTALTSFLMGRRGQGFFLAIGEMLETKNYCYSIEQLYKYSNKYN